MVAASDVSQILVQMRGGSRDAVNRLFPIIYPELRQLAVRSLRRERGDHTLQATALVHEAYLRLVGQTRIDWRDRAHFVAAASQTIRRVLVDHARTRARRKRAGRWQRIPLELAIAQAPSRSVDLLALDEALEKLALDAPRKARVVELRFFGGATVAEVAEVLDVTTRSVERDWQFARAWLFREMSRGGEFADRENTYEAH